MTVDLRPPGGVVSIWAVFFLLSGPYLLLNGVVVGSVEVIVFAAVLITLGVGLWLRQTWARWLGGMLGIFAMGWATTSMSRDGVTILPAALLFAAIGLVAEMWSWNVRADSPTPTDSGSGGSSPEREADSAAAGGSASGGSTEEVLSAETGSSLGNDGGSSGTSSA